MTKHERIARSSIRFDVQVRVMEDEQEAELRNPFPSPPSHYTNYTTHNLQLLSLLKERTEGQNASESTQTEMLSDQKDVPEWPLTSLEKPRVDWIREEGHYNVFGDTWFVRLAQSSVASDVRLVHSSSKKRSPLSERWVAISCIQRTPPQVGASRSMPSMPQPAPKMP